MLTDRRPILLANARVVDPSRDFDGPGDVLMEILYCGICHTDIHQARGEWNNST